jgi:hypothetical protein
MENNLAEQLRKKTLILLENSVSSDYPPKNKYFSPDDKYYFENESFTKPINDGVTFGSYFFMKIAIYEKINQTKIGEFLTNHIELEHLWLTKEGKSYLYLVELRNGISVFDLTERTLYTHISKNDWQQIHKYYLSPNVEKLAVIKYSNSGFLLEVFDCSEPTQLPYSVLFKKHLTEANGHYVESIVWLDNFNFDIITKEQIRLGKAFLKVKVIGVIDDGFRVKCSFNDIYGKEYICFEKNQAMFDFMPDENTIWPLNGAVDVHLIRKFAKNGQNYAVISAEVEEGYHNSGEIEVFQNQIDTYWYYKKDPLE